MSLHESMKSCVSIRGVRLVALGVAFLLNASVSWAVTAAAASSTQQPNVIIILTDDQGYGDLSCHGNPILKTPHLDRLHSQSVRFTDFHVTPVCTPTRGQLMTGLDALRNGAHTVPAGHNLIWRDIPTMPEMFRNGGYRTGLFGKWHLGDTYPDRPMDRGFEKAIWFLGHGVASSSEFDNDCVNIRYLDGTETKQSDRYCTDLWFDEAMRWMDGQRRQGKPFFTYIAPNAPHGPHWVLEKDAAPYRSQVPGATADFFGMIANIDDNVGKLLDWLEQTRLAENTIVIFLTDNGGTAGTKVFNAGMREGKGGNYEGGHRAACFVRWPGGGLTAPRDVATPTQVQDILPTLLDLCGVPAPAKARFDGLTLAPLLRDPQATLPDRLMVVQYGGRIRPAKHDACVIWGQWRLVRGRELYDIERDLAQERDVAQQHPDIVTRMREHYERWWTALLPRMNEYQPIVVGSQNENPVLLNPNMWEAVDVDNHRRVALAEGGPRGGSWNVLVERAGNYEIELRRWPFHTDCALGSEAPQSTVSGRALNLRTRRTPVASAALTVAGKEVTARAAPADLGVRLRIRLPAGHTKMQAWFRDASGNDLCGAFYVRVHRL
jgi:arylsulfatase A-like enzyme